MKKILILIGTRPEAIKLAPLIKAFKQEKELFSLRVCATGQHVEMVEEVFDFFDITADSHLKTMTTGQSLTALSSVLLKEIEKDLKKFNPDYVFVQGDTNSALAGALAGFYHGAKICHVEAGLRTFQNRDPFPEEMNRKLIAQIADWHFAPTMRAKVNLQQEGIPEKKITVSGNTVIDALNLGMKKIDKKQYASISRIKKLLDFPSKPFILATVHRRENQGEKLKNICEALQLMATSFGINIIIPVHPNPLISDVLNSTLRGVENIKLIEPVPYPGFLWLMKNCQLIVTDSGGIQEEATGIGKNVVLLRETTERKEAIEKGFVFKAGTDPEKILRMTKSLLDKKSDPGKKDIFGAGDAAENIIDFIKKLH